MNWAIGNGSKAYLVSFPDSAEDVGEMVANGSHGALIPLQILSDTLALVDQN